MKGKGAWIAIFLLAFGLRMALLFSLEGTPFDEGLFYDSLQYEQAAEKALAGEPLTTGAYFTDPLYAYFLAFLFLLSGRSLFAVRLVQALLGAASAVLAGWIGKEVSGDRRVGILSGIGTASYGMLIFYDLQILKVSLEVFLGLLAAALLLKARRGGSKRLTLPAGLILGLAILVHGSYLLLLPAFALWMVLDRGRAGRKEACLAAATLVLGAGMILAPVTIRNAVRSGQFVLTTYNGGINFWEGNNPEADGAYHRPAFYRGEPSLEEMKSRDEAVRRTGRPLGPAEISSFWFGESFRWIGEHPSEWLLLLGRKLLLFWNSHEVADGMGYYFVRLFVPFLSLPFPGFFLWAPLGLAGLALCAPARRRWALPYLFVACQVSAVMLFHVVDRYRLPAVPFLIMFGSAGLVATWSALRERRASRAAGHLALFAAAAAIVNLPHFYAPEMTFSQPHHELARYYLRQGDTAAAESHCRASIEVDPDNGLAHGLLGKILLASDRNEEALGHFRRSLETGPLRADSIFGEAAALLQLGRAEPAKKVLLRFAAGEVPPQVDFWGEKWAAYLDIPRKGEGLLLLGGVYEEAGWEDLAEEAYRASLTVYPAPAVYAALAGLLLAKERHVEAVKYSREGIRAAAGEIVPAHLFLARAYLALGKAREALGWLEKAKPRYVRSDIFWETRGKALDSLGDTQGAYESYRHLVGQPEDPAVSLRLAALFLQAGLPAKAETLVKRHMDRVGEDAEAFNLLGVALGLLGRSEEAREAFSRAVALDPDSEVFRANLERESLKLEKGETGEPDRP